MDVYIRTLCGCVLWLSLSVSNAVEVDLTKLRGVESEAQPWSRVMDLERLLCGTAAIFTRLLYRSKVRKWCSIQCVQIW